MAGIRWPPEDSDPVVPRPPPSSGAVGDLVSDDDRSVAADSWSIKSEYGSTLDDEQRHVDASEVLSAANFRAASDYSSDKDEPDVNDVESSMLGLQSYWDASYAEDLANYREHGQAGEVWFGVEVMDTVASWTRNLCLNMTQHTNVAEDSSCKCETRDTINDLSTWSVLDIGTGNGLLLHELAKQGFSDLTGTDYSEGAIELARRISIRDGFPNLNFLVDDILETKLDRKFQLVTDKGTLDAIGLHPDGPLKRTMYWESLMNLVAPGGILVITSCNNTKDELMQEVDSFNQRNELSDNLERAKRKGPETTVGEGCGRERLKRHRGEMAGRTCVPDAWGMDSLLSDWACFPTALDSSLAPAGASLARQALVAEFRRTPELRSPSS